MPTFVPPYPEADRFVRNGPTGLRTWRVFDADPSGVYTAPAGTLGFLRTGLLGWINVDGTATGWRPLPDLTAAQIAALQSVAAREAARQSGTFGVACTAFDVPLFDYDARGGLLYVTFRGATPDANFQQFNLRLNGVAGDLVLTGFYADDPALPTLFAAPAPQISQVNAGGPAAGAKWTVVVQCQAFKSGRRRRVRLFAYTDLDPTTPTSRLVVYEYNWQSVANLTTVGIESTLANGMTASSEYEVIWL